MAILNFIGGSGGGASTLQTAYVAGNAIVESLADGPVSITNPPATAQPALTVVQGTAGQFAIDATGDVRVTGKLTVTGLIDPSGVYLDEQGADLPAIANKGVTYTKDMAGVTQLFYRADDGTVTQLTPPAGGGGTLDQAYDFGGPGAGRLITADSDAVQIDKASVDANNAFFVNVTAGTGLAALFSGASISCPTASVDSERFGFGADVVADGGTAIGNGADVDQKFSLAAGWHAYTGGPAKEFSVAIGGMAEAHDTHITVVGGKATGDAASGGAVGIGYLSTIVGSGECVAIGVSSTITGSFRAIAIGQSATVAGASFGLAIGDAASVTATTGIAIGRLSVSAFANSVAIGQVATTTAINQVVFGSETSPLTSHNFGSGVTAGVPTAAVTFSSTTATTATNAGSSIVWRTGNGATTGSSGAFTINVPTNADPNASTGDISLLIDGADGTGTPGNFVVQAGDCDVSPQAGSIYLSCGAGSLLGGEIVLTTGASSGTNGGDLALTCGSGAVVGGSIFMTAGSGGVSGGNVVAYGGAFAAPLPALSTGGFFYFPRVATAPAGVPLAPAGFVNPMCYDEVADILYIYSFALATWLPH